MPRIKLTIEYDGANYVGWQTQVRGRTVQGAVEDTLEELLGERVELEAASRTDAGVHALAQVVAFNTTRVLPLTAYSRGMNGQLPQDIAIVAAHEVSPDFDPRRWSKGKRYRYLIGNWSQRSPVHRHSHWEIFQKLDVEAMQRAAPYLIGRHDFSAFRAKNCQARHAMREMKKIEVEARERGEIVITVEGTAFLRHMVRNLVGTLVKVGRRKEMPEWVGRVLASKDRTLAGVTAPPHGLTLLEVIYPPGASGEIPPTGERRPNVKPLTTVDPVDPDELDAEE